MVVRILRDSAFVSGLIGSTPHPLHRIPKPLLLHAPEESLIDRVAAFISYQGVYLTIRADTILRFALQGVVKPFLYMSWREYTEAEEASYPLALRHFIPIISGVGVGTF